MPRIPDLDHLRRKLKRAVQALGSAEDSSPAGELSTSESEDDSAREDATWSVDQKYPILKDLGIDTDLSKTKNTNFIMDAGTLEHGHRRSGPLPKIPLLGQSTLVR